MGDRFPEFIYGPNDVHGEDEPIATQARVSAENQWIAKAILEMPPGEETRSNLTWLRLANGDLMLGVWPSGLNYETITDAVDADFGSPA